MATEKKAAKKSAPKKEAAKKAAPRKKASKEPVKPSAPQVDEKVLKIAKSVFKSRNGHEWDQAHEWEQRATINAVDFYNQNRKAGAEDYHNHWTKENKANGWKYGSIKDFGLKEHPCLVEFKNLPDNQRNQDIEFAERVKNML